MNKEREKLADPYAMTVANLRRRSNAVYLACEATVAEDISKALRWAADEIERLSEAHAEIHRLQEAKRRALALADERAKENVALRAALAAPASEGVRWQPIDTAPKDGTWILTCSMPWAAIPTALRWDEYRWWDDADEPEVGSAVEWHPSHWMPLPAAPEPTDTPDEGPDPLGYAKGERL